MPTVKLFLRNSEIINEHLHLVEFSMTNRRKVTLDMVALDEIEAKRDFAYLPGTEIHRLIINFDDDEGKKYFKWLKPNAAPEWIPVCEKLPPYGESVLVFIKANDWEHGKIKITNRTHTDAMGEHWSEAYDHYITHWMPLPAAPTE